MKKRITAIVMTVIMAVSVAACNKEKVDTSVEASVEASVETSVSVEASVEEKVPEEAVKEETKEVENLADETKKETPVFKGTFVDAEGNPADKAAEGTVYVNEYFGFKVVPAEGYFFLSDASDAYVEDAAADFLAESDDSLAQEIADDLREESKSEFSLTEATQLYTLTTNIDYAGPFVSESDMDALIDETLAQMESVFAVDTVKDLDLERATVSFMGKDTSCIRGCIKMEMQGVTFDFYMVSVSLIKNGYICTFSFGSYLQDKCDELLEMVQPLE